MSNESKSVPSVSVTYAQSGASTQSNALGMWAMAFQAGAQYSYEIVVDAMRVRP